MLGNRFRKRSRKKVAHRLAKWLYEEEQDLAQATLPAFRNNPRNVSIDLPRRIINAHLIHMGDDVNLGPGSLLIAITRYPGPSMNAPPSVAVQTFTPSVSIGSRVTSTGGLQVAALERIVIEDDVLIASNVNITDGLHGYGRADQPYKYQPMEQIAPIHIKRGCWIGQNVVVLPGVTIGEFTIVGANSVVTQSLPPRSIAVGAPARIKKVWDEQTGTWESAVSFE